MMHGAGWYGMGFYWLIPVLIVVLVILAWGVFARRRSPDRR
jgi:cytochrome c-type biogenesis protein CcmH/NrfF